MFLEDHSEPIKKHLRRFCNASGLVPKRSEQINELITAFPTLDAHGWGIVVDSMIKTYIPNVFVFPVPAIFGGYISQYQNDEYNRTQAARTRKTISEPQTDDDRENLDEFDRMVKLMASKKTIGNGNLRTTPGGRKYLDDEGFCDKRRAVQDELMKIGAGLYDLSLIQKKKK